jgi:hypothetical protein
LSRGFKRYLALPPWNEEETLFLLFKSSNLLPNLRLPLKTLLSIGYKTTHILNTEQGLLLPQVFQSETEAQAFLSDLLGKPGDFNGNHLTIEPIIKAQAFLDFGLLFG